MAASSPKSNGFKVAAWAVFAVAAVVAAYCLWSVAFTAWLGQKQVLDPLTLLAYATEGTKRQRGMLWLTAMLPVALAALGAFAVLYNPVKQFGDARFGNASELQQAGLAASVGVILGRAFGKLVIAPSPGNVIVCAPPGAGKSTGIAIPTLLTWQGSVLALDTKFELFETTAGLRAKSGQRVFLFAPMTTHTHRFNPLGYLSTGPQVVDEIDRIANFLIPSENPSDMWTAEARALFVGVALHLFTSNGRVSVGDVYEWCRDGEATWDKCKRVVDAGEVKHSEAARLLGDFGAKPPKEASGVKSTLTGALNLWGNPVVRAATAENDFDLRELRRTPTSIYIGVAPPDLARIEKLLALLYQLMIDGLCRALPAKDEKHEVLMLMDEFAAAGYMPLIKKGLAFLRGYAVRVCIIIQSPAQMEEIYGPAGRRAIYDSCRYHCYFQPNEFETAQAISRQLGTYTVQTKTRNVSSQGGTSRNYASGKRELLLPDEVMRFGADHILVFAEGSRPFRIRKLRYFDDKRLTARAGIATPAIPNVLMEPPRVEVDEAALLDAALLELTQVMAEEAGLHGMTDDAAALQAQVTAILAGMRGREKLDEAVEAA